MTRLPVFATLAATYRFLFREFAAVIRLAWFPFLVTAVVQYFAAEGTLDALAAVQGAADQPPASPYDLIQWIVQIVVFAIVAVSLHRLILFGDRKPGQYIAFAFGRAEMLFLVLQVAIFAGFVAVGVAWALAVGAGANGALIPAGGWPIALLAVAALALIYFFTRVAPVYPIVVAENRLDLARSWALTRGQFWRLLAVFMLGALPLGLLVAGAEGLFWALVSRDFAGREIAADEAVEITRGLIVYQVGIFYVAAVATAGLTSALLCFSYKALRGLKPDDLLTPEYQVRP
jgi:hypothetical protein